MGKIIQACVHHRPEYTQASVRYFLNRSSPHVINETETEKETVINQGISYKNSYPRQTPSNKKGRVNFTYI